MSIDAHSMTPGDLYIDGEGHVWQVRAICLQPSVTMERLLDRDELRARGEPPVISGGQSGLMWDRFQPLLLKDGTTANYCNVRGRKPAEGKEP